MFSSTFCFTYLLILEGFTDVLYQFVTVLFPYRTILSLGFTLVEDEDDDNIVIVVVSSSRPSFYCHCCLLNSSITTYTHPLRYLKLQYHRFFSLSWWMRTIKIKLSIRAKNNSFRSSMLTSFVKSIYCQIVVSSRGSHIPGIEPISITNFSWYCHW